MLVIDRAKTYFTGVLVYGFCPVCEGIRFCRSTTPDDSVCPGVFQAGRKIFIMIEEAQEWIFH